QQTSLTAPYYHTTPAMIFSRITPDDNDTLYRIKQDLLTPKQAQSTTTTTHQNFANYQNLVEAKREKIIRDKTPPKIRLHKFFETMPSLKKDAEEDTPTAWYAPKNSDKESRLGRVTSTKSETTGEKDANEDERFRKIIEKYSIGSPQEPPTVDPFKDHTRTKDTKLQDSIEDLRAELEVMRLSHEQDIQDLKISHQSQISKIQSTHDRQIQALQDSQKEMIKQLQLTQRETVQDLQDSLIDKDTQLQRLTAQLQEQERRLTIMEQSYNDNRPSYAITPTDQTSSTATPQTPTHIRRSYQSTNPRRVNTNTKLLLNSSFRPHMRSTPRPSSSTIVQEESTDYYLNTNPSSL
ncbi:hypothetical protein WICPIJ_009025, partial [Wickerhamomyces pijperi]